MPISNTAQQQPRTWADLLGTFTGPITPLTRSPKAWAAVNAGLGTSAAPLFAGATLSTFQQSLALKLVNALVAAADAFEPELPTLGSSESAAHVAWRADLAAVNRLVADVDGGASTGATSRELNSRIETTRTNPGLSGGQATLLAALRVPPETGVDAAFNDALDAVRFFFL